MLGRWIRGYQVAAFFALTYGLSWELWPPWMLAHIEVLELLALIGFFAPALACIAIARVALDGRTGSYRGSRRATLVAACILSTTIFVFNARSGLCGCS